MISAVLAKTNVIMIFDSPIFSILALYLHYLCCVWQGKHHNDHCSYSSFVVFRSDYPEVLKRVVLLASFVR